MSDSENQTGEDCKSPLELRAEAITAAILSIAEELASPSAVGDIEAAAVESDNGESDKPIMAKCSIALTWQAGSAAPNVEGKISYTTKHTDTADRVVDPAQGKLQFNREEAA